MVTFEFSISNVKWLLLGLYKLLSVKDDTFFDQIKLALNSYSKSFEDFILKDDFSITGGNWKLNDLMNTISLEKLKSPPDSINDTQKFLCLLCSIPPLHDDKELVSYDVESLFTNIPLG